MEFKQMLADSGRFKSLDLTAEKMEAVLGSLGLVRTRQSKGQPRFLSISIYQVP